MNSANSLPKTRLAHRKSREEIFKSVQGLRDQGLICSEIARGTGFSRRSVSNWLKFETPPDRKCAALEYSSAWFYEEFLRHCWESGIRTGSALVPLIQERGYEGGISNLQRLLAA